MGSSGTRRNLMPQSREKGLITLIEEMRTRLAEIEAYASTAYGQAPTRLRMRRL
jgi:hypothetical protein